MSDSHGHWTARAREVAGTLAADALDRDRANAEPAAEVKLLKGARLPGLLIPESLGGAGQTWRTALAVVREIVRADGSVAQLKVVSTDTALHVTSKIFEVTGARSTGSRYGFDRFWRNVRTHTLHDPVAYKRREVGAHYLTGQVPDFTLYT